MGLAAVAALAVGLLPGCVGLSPIVWVESQENLELPAADVETLAVLTHNGTSRSALPKGTPIRSPLRSPSEPVD